jgi:hypothetical protein
MVIRGDYSTRMTPLDEEIDSGMRDIAMTKGERELNEDIRKN